MNKCYKTGHYGALMKASARIPEAREFISLYDMSLSVSENAECALNGRWYGNASPSVCRELTRFFYERFVVYHGHLEVLKRFLFNCEDVSLSVLNHFYMVLRDPYYRWAASQWLPHRLEMGLTDVPRESFEQDARVILSNGLSPKTMTRYCRNILTALRDNCYLSGKSTKSISSPSLNVSSLAFMLFTAKELGEGFNSFDGSPLFYSLLKPRSMLVPLFREGENRGWWEFTGDNSYIKGSFKLKNLEAFLEEVVV